jgi:hypothetical protein
MINSVKVCDKLSLLDPINMNTIQASILLIAVLAFILNSYKFGMMKVDIPYYIFPWMEYITGKVGMLAKSTPEWLQVHLFFALCNEMASVRVLFATQTDRKQLRFMREACHWMFISLTIQNILNFGQYSPLVALLANGIPLIGLHYSYYNNLYLAYFIFLNIPIAIEVVTLLYELSILGVFYVLSFYIPIGVGH